MTDCVRGCTVPGQHRPGCTCTTTCPPHPDHCLGCAPAEAVDGLLCQTDGRWFRDWLGEREGLGREGRESHGLAWAWEHLGVAYPRLSVGPDTGRSGGSVVDREAEKLAAVVSLRSDIAQWLGSVTADLSERIKLPPPAGVFVTTDYRSRCVGLPAAGEAVDNSLAGRDWRLVKRCQDWLLRHVDPLLAGAGIEAHPGVEGDVARAADAFDRRADSVRLLWGQLGASVPDGGADLMSRAHALAPWRPRPTRIDGIPCRCGQCALDDMGDRVKCEKCGATYTWEHYQRLVKVLARRFERYADEQAEAAAS